MAKTKPRVSSGRSRLLDQAKLEALLKFGPQIQALAQLGADARSTAAGSVKAANTVADTVGASLRGAKPKLAGIYDEAGLEQARTAESLIGKDLAALGPAADAFKGAAASEQGVALANMRSAKAQALGELTERLTAAEGGRQQGVLQARGQLTSDLAKIGSQRADLAAQAGTQQSASYGRLVGEQVERQFKREGDRLDRASAEGIAAGHDVTSTANNIRTTAAKAKGKATLPGGMPINSAKDHAALMTEIAKARVWADRLAKSPAYGKLSARERRQRIGQLLLLGSPEEKEYSGGPVKSPEVPSFSQAATSTALDQIFNPGGRVSLGTIRDYLHAAGYSAKQLRLAVLTPQEKARMEREEKARLRRGAKARRQAASFGLPTFGGG